MLDNLVLILPTAPASSYTQIDAGAFPGGTNIGNPIGFNLDSKNYTEITDVSGNSFVSAIGYDANSNMEGLTNKHKLNIIDHAPTNSTWITSGISVWDEYYSILFAITPIDLGNGHPIFRYLSLVHANENPNYIGFILSQTGIGDSGSDFFYSNDTTPNSKLDIFIFIIKRKLIIIFTK